MSGLTDKSDAQQGLKLSYMETEKALKTIAFSPLVPEKYDYVSVDSTGSDFDVYIFKMGGSIGLVVGTLILTFTDNTKSVLLSVEKVI